MNHYKEKTRSVQLTHTKTPPHKHHHKCKNQNKKQERTTRKNRQKAHDHTKNRHTVPAQFRFRSIKKAASPTKKKPLVRRPQNSTAKNTAHAQRPLFQRLRAAPARAKPPVNFALDRQGRKGEKASKERKKIVKPREPQQTKQKKKAKQLAKRTKKNVKKTQKCANNGKERHITKNKPSNHAKLSKQYEKQRFNTEMLNKCKPPTNNIQRQKKNIKTDINNEEKLAQKNTNQRQKATLKKTRKTQQAMRKKDRQLLKNHTTSENNTN